MALTARLQFGTNDTEKYISNEYMVSNFHCHFVRHHNHLHPDEKARCERIELIVKAPGKNDLNLYEWYINGDQKEGRIVFDLKAVDGDFNGVLLFKDAYCFALGEEYHIDKKECRYLKLSIVAEDITLSALETPIELPLF